MNDRALADLKIVDVSRCRAGAYCSKLFAGFGADVVKVEPPEIGDPLRGNGPFYTDPEGNRYGIPFLWLNTGKKSVVLSPDDERDRQAFMRFLDRCDILIDSGTPCGLAEWGLSPDDLVQRNPQLIVASASPFGRTGPYCEFEAEEITLYAMSGCMHLTGATDRPPLGPGVPVTFYSTGLTLYVGILIALLERSTSGLGQQVETSMQEVGIDNIELAVINHLRRGDNPVRKRHPMVPWGLYRCQDGYVNVICGPFRHWTRGCGVFEEPRLLEPKYRHIRDRAACPEEIDTLLEPWLAKRTRREIFEAGQARKMAWGYLCSLAETMQLAQLCARAFFQAVEDPSGGTFEYADAPFILSDMPWKTEGAPRLGEHNGMTCEPSSPSEGEPATETGTSGTLPLSGIRVLDLTQSWAAPHGTRLLADFGAEVIIVEYTKLLCMLRGGNVNEKMYNKHPMWLQVNRGKKSITLDLRDEGDTAAFRKLVKTSDVVIHNSRSGVMEALGLGEDVLQALNPNLIQVAMPAFGSTGPLARYAGYGAVMEGMGGIHVLTGYNTDEPPVRIKELDIVNGIVATAAALTALVARARTGRAQTVDVSQMEAGIHALAGEHLLEFAMTGVESPAIGNRHRAFAPQGCYRCLGDDNWITITIRSDEEWARLCAILDRPKLAESDRFTTADKRRQHHDAIDDLIEVWTRSMSKHDAMGALQARGIAAGAVLNIPDLVKDPQLAQASYFREADDGSAGLFPGIPIRLSRTPGSIRWPGPELGQHNAYVRCELLGEPASVIHPIKDQELVTAFDP